MIRRYAVGTAVVRKRDGASGSVVEVGESFTRGVLSPFKTLISVRLDDEALRTRAGGDMVGDLGWFRSNFKETK